MAATEFFPGDEVLVRDRGDREALDQFYRRGRLVHKVQSCRGLWVVESCGSRQLLSALDLVRLDPGNLEPGDPEQTPACCQSSTCYDSNHICSLATSPAPSCCRASICCYDNSLISWPSSCHHGGRTTCPQPTYGQGSGSVFSTCEDDESVQSTESKRRPPWRNWRRTGPEPHHKRPGGAVSCSSPQVCYVSFPSAQSRASANYSSALFLPLTNLMRRNIQTQAPPSAGYSQSQQHL
uniref:Uncharacterized protein n=1 Tax=Knipowitschia caucasica TaxID=637954 RepID=A0AAV2KXR3_KNICA